MREKSCGVVVFRHAAGQRLYLLLQYDAGHWDFIKGHIEKNESEERTARREAAEETGIVDLGFFPNFRENISYFFTQDGRTVFKEVVFFVAETATENVELSDEHQDYAWLPYEQAIEKLTFKNAKDVLKKAESFLEKKE